jgi:hypothetical protein
MPSYRTLIGSQATTCVGRCKPSRPAVERPSTCRRLPSTRCTSQIQCLKGCPKTKIYTSDRHSNKFDHQSSFLRGVVEASVPSLAGLPPSNVRIVGHPIQRHQRRFQNSIKSMSNQFLTGAVTVEAAPLTQFGGHITLSKSRRVTQEACLVPVTVCRYESVSQTISIDFTIFLVIIVVQFFQAGLQSSPTRPSPWWHPPSAKSTNLLASRRRGVFPWTTIQPKSAVKCLANWGISTGGGASPLFAPMKSSGLQPVVPTHSKPTKMVPMKTPTQSALIVANRRAVATVLPTC